jgi:hypothetical protein
MFRCDAGTALTITATNDTVRPACGGQRSLQFIRHKVKRTMTSSALLEHEGVFFYRDTDKRPTFMPVIHTPESWRVSAGYREHLIIASFVQSLQDGHLDSLP